MGANSWVLEVVKFLTESGEDPDVTWNKTQLYSLDGVNYIVRIMRYDKVL